MSRHRSVMFSPSLVRSFRVECFIDVLVIVDVWSAGVRLRLPLGHGSPVGVVDPVNVQDCVSVITIWNFGHGLNKNNTLIQNNFMKISYDFPKVCSTSSIAAWVKSFGISSYFLLQPSLYPLEWKIKHFLVYSYSSIKFKPEKEEYPVFLFVVSTKPPRSNWSQTLSPWICLFLSRTRNCYTISHLCKIQENTVGCRCSNVLQARIHGSSHRDNFLPILHQRHPRQDRIISITLLSMLMLRTRTWSCLLHPHLPSQRTWRSTSQGSGLWTWSEYCPNHSWCRQPRI